MVGYKNGSQEAHTLISALLAAYLTEHEARIASALGGPISAIAIVPSMSRGRSFETNPLAHAIRRSVKFRGLLEPVLRHTGEPVGRQEYKPAACAVERTAIRDGRIVLIEDLWVSGSRAISAAGALLDGGAESVLVLPVAREIRPENLDYCPEEYVRATKAPYDVTHWPR